MFINKLWKTGQIGTNTGFILLFATFIHVSMCIPWREQKIPNIQCVNNRFLGGKHRFITLKNVDAWTVKRFGGGRSIPISGIKKSYACCFQQAYTFTEVNSYPQGKFTHNVKKTAESCCFQRMPAVDQMLTKVDKLICFIIPKTKQILYPLIHRPNSNS